MASISRAAAPPAAGAVAHAQEGQTDYRRIGLFTVAHFVNDLYGQFLPILLPLLALTIGFNLGAAAVVVTAYTITSSIIQPLLGHFADRHTTRFISVLGLAAAAAGAALLGVASNFVLLVLFAVIAGVGTAAYHPQAAAMVVAVAGRRRSTMMSLYLVGGSIGFALGPALIDRVARADLHLTPLLMIPGLLMAAVLAVYAPRDWRPAGLHGEMPSLWRVLYNHRAVLSILLGVVILRSWAQLGVSTFLPFYYEEHGARVGLAAVVLTVFSLTGAFGGLIGGFLADKFSQKPVISISLFAAGPLLLALPHLSGPVLYLTAAVSGILLLSSWNVLTVKGQEILSRNVGMASGLMLGFSIGIGGLGAIPMGFIGEHTGTLSILIFTAALAPLAGLLSLLLPD